MSWRFMAIEHDLGWSCSRLQCTLRHTVACPQYNSIQTTLRLVGDMAYPIYYKTKKKGACHCPRCPTVPTYSPCDETCPFIRSFHSSTLWTTESTSDAERPYSPSLPCSNPTSIGRVWAPLNIRGRWTGSREVGAMRDWNFSFPWMSELHALFLTPTKKWHWHLSVDLGSSSLTTSSAITKNRHHSSRTVTLNGKVIHTCCGESPRSSRPLITHGKASSAGSLRNVTHRQSYAIAEWIHQ